MNEQTIAKLLAYLTTKTKLNISQSDLQQFTGYLNKQNFDLASFMLEDLASGVIPETDTFWLIADLLLEIDSLFLEIDSLFLEIDRIASQYN